MPYRYGLKRHHAWHPSRIGGLAFLRLPGHRTDAGMVGRTWVSHNQGAEVMKYLKFIEVTQTGMVVARVLHEESGRCVGLEFFSSLFMTNLAVERLFQKAHDWADKRIQLCQAYETQGEVK